MNKVHIKTFLDSLLSIDDCNFFQLSLLSQDNVKETDSEDVKAFSTSLSKDEYYSTMAHLMDNNYKFHQRKYNETIIGDVHYHNHKNEDINIFQLSTKQMSAFQNSIIGFGQNKTKLSIINIPSTKDISYESYKSVLSFRISNRVLFNFINGVNDNDNFYNIVLSYNHEKNVDLNNVIKDIEKVLNIALKLQ
jgi:hypothetical protein